MSAPIPLKTAGFTTGGFLILGLYAPGPYERSPEDIFGKMKANKSIV